MVLGGPIQLRMFCALGIGDDGQTSSNNTKAGLRKSELYLKFSGGKRNPLNTSAWL